MKKTTSYRETFRQHRLLLSLPIILATIIAGVFVLGSAKSYESTASLWVDSPASDASTLGNLNPALTPPSQSEQDIVTELLATHSFDLTVGHQSALGPYLASHSGGSGLSGILSKLGGGGSLDDQIIGALGPSNVLTTTPGPQVLEIDYIGPTPAVAQSTLKTLVNELQRNSVRLSQQHAQAAAAYYKGQVQAATAGLASARDATTAYMRQHPGATSSDPNLNALITAQGAASSQLTQANANLNAAVSSNGGGSAVQVLDAASFPPGPTSGKKKVLEGLVGGLIVGAMLSFLGTLLLTRGKSDPWEDQLEEGHTGANQPAFATANGQGSAASVSPLRPDQREALRSRLEHPQRRLLMANGGHITPARFPGAGGEQSPGGAGDEPLHG